MSRENTLNSPNGKIRFKHEHEPQSMYYGWAILILNYVTNERTPESKECKMKVEPRRTLKVLSVRWWAQCARISDAHNSTTNQSFELHSSPFNSEIPSFLSQRNLLNSWSFYLYFATPRSDYFACFQSMVKKGGRKMRKQTTQYALHSRITDTVHTAQCTSSEWVPSVCECTTAKQRRERREEEKIEHRFFLFRFNDAEYRRASNENHFMAHSIRG